MRLVVISVALIALLHAGNASAERLTKMMFLTGDQLAGICNSSVRSVDRSEMCKMYVAGVLDDIAFEQSINADNIPVCAPEGTTVDHVIEVINSYWRGLEGKFNGSAVMMIRVALTKWDPCPPWMWDKTAN
ncbi:MAG: Rap1a/Tai family immunity protein [Thalassospira sp.]|uniref:Rap1a/Tai family immunity protein n=1 Tax=Thalassospira sp. TaxID=1912094 RepID=UPI003A893B29